MTHLNYKHIISVPTLFCMMAVTLVPLNIEKIYAIAVSYFLILKFLNRITINKTLLFISSSFLLLLLINIESFTIQPHHSLLFLFHLFLIFIFSSIARTTNIIFFLLTIYFSLAAFLTCGALFWVLSHSLSLDLYVGAMYEKSDSGIKAAYSFTTTPQVFGTYSALFIVISIYLKKFGIIYNSIFKFGIILSIFCVIISLNRVWTIFLIFPVLQLIGLRKTYLTSIFSIFLIAFLFFLSLTFYKNFPWSDFSTLRSRYDLFQLGLDFLSEKNFNDYLFGIPFYSEPYYQYHDRDFYLIENGYLFLAINFGIFGLFLYTLLFFFFARKAAFDGLIYISSIYYFAIVPIFTHELYSFSFVLFCISIYLLWLYARNTKLAQHNTEPLPYSPLPRLTPIAHRKENKTSYISG